MSKLTGHTYKSKNEAWEKFINTPGAKCDLSKVFFGKNPQDAFDKVSEKLKNTLGDTSASKKKESLKKPVKKIPNVKKK